MPENLENPILNNVPVVSKLNSLSLFDSSKEASDYVAHQVASLIRERQREGRTAVLGLATGSTPKGVYEELIRLHKNEGLSFKNVISFNLDEYYPIHSQDMRSYSYFMREFLFNHVDVDPQNVHIPHVKDSAERLCVYCEEYEERISRSGGIDLQLLGIGRNGHIGFNEPGSSFDSVTRLIDLHPVTRSDAQMYFGGIENVPKQAVSIGIKTISSARKIILLALGEAKSKIIKEAIRGEVTPEVPASILQSLPNVEYVFDRQAAMLL